MSNERRIYKNYYMTDRAYVDISQAAAGENVGKLGMTKKILCWPKKTYDGDAALELIPQKQGEPFSVTVPLGGQDFSDKDALSIAVNGATPCDMIKIEIYGANGEKSVDEINFFNDRWSRLLVSLAGNVAVRAAEKMVISFYSVKGIPVESENAYIGEIYFGNIVDFRFEKGDFVRYFSGGGKLSGGKLTDGGKLSGGKLTDGKTSAGGKISSDDGFLEYEFSDFEPLVFPTFLKARYSVLNAVVSIKDSLRITADNLGECEDFRLYVLTDKKKKYSKKSVAFRLEKGGIKTTIVPIESLVSSAGERLAGIKIEPLRKAGKIRLFEVAPSQEKDIIGDDLAKSFMNKKPVAVKNPYRVKIAGKTYYAKDFGAKGNFYDNDTEAIQRAIDKAAGEGGGKVVLKDGCFVATHIVMKSGVELDIDESATLVQSEVPAHYAYPVAYEHDNFYYSIQWAHNFLVHNKPLVYGNGISRFKVTGKGRIRMADTGSEALCGGWPYYDIHCNSLIHIIPIMFNKCTDFEVSGVTIARANSYHLFTAHCKNVFINDVKFIDPRCLSADGIGINGSKNYLIANVTMVTNDDGVTLNPGYIDPRGYDGNYWDCTPDADNSIDNIEICHSYINSAYGGWGKAIAFIPWGKSGENQEFEMTENVFVHDCILKGGCAVGTWCDDPYHGKQPFDGTETDDYSPVVDITFRNNLYLSKSDLLTVKVTNMVSDNELKSSVEVVNGDFHDRLCNWKRSGAVEFSLSDSCVRLGGNVEGADNAAAKNVIKENVAMENAENGENGEIRQILSSEKGMNRFAAEVLGKGVLFIDDEKTPFDVTEKTVITVEKQYRSVKNIAVGVASDGKATVYRIEKR